MTTHELNNLLGGAHGGEEAALVALFARCLRPPRFRSWRGFLNVTWRRDSRNDCKMRSKHEPRDKGEPFGPRYND